MNHQKSQKLLSRLFEPTRVFIAVLISVLIWLYPAMIGGTDTQQSSKHRPLINCFVLTDSAFATDSDSPGRDCGDCYQGCTEWDQFGCNEWGDICDPCPPPPPVYSPPQINGTLGCSNWGNNGWCIGSLALNLSASDPQNMSMIISGILNSTDFSCSTNCSTLTVPINAEGTGTIPYRVDSATGLNASGSIDYQLDSSTPALNRTLSGVAGTNDWYRSDVTLNVTASDAITGIASITASINGGAPSIVSGPLSFSDGIHTVTLTAADNAGNITQNTETIQVDTITPTLSTSLSGTSGLNGWYVSPVSITPSASDSGSGIVTLEASLDGGAWSEVSGSQSFSDGIHTYQFRATDNAGNVTEGVQQTVKVDTTTPVLNLAIAGKKGMNGWYVSTVTVTPEVNDVTSGIALLEGAPDGGEWRTVDALTFIDGLHSYRFKLTDLAGNSTTSPLQNLKIDTIFPDIDMTESLSLGEPVEYSLEDHGSGLFKYQAVIEDDRERYKKIVWFDDLSGDKEEYQILWDGKFADGEQAGWGDYYITLKISDAAGNEAKKSAVVNVNPFSFLKEIPAFAPPQSSSRTQLDSDTQSESSPFTFGGENNNNIDGAEAVITNEGGASLRWTEDVITKTSFSIESASTNTSPFSAANILWGAAATALIGATLADWQRKREEEARARTRTRRERLAAEGGPIDVDEGSNYGRIAKAYQASLNAFKATLVSKGLSPPEAASYKTQAIKNGSIPSAAVVIANENRSDAIEAKMAREEAAEETRWLSAQAAIAQSKQEMETVAFEYRMSEHDITPIPLAAKESDAIKTAISPENNSWLSKIPFIGPQLDTAWLNSSLKQVWEEKVYEPYIQPNVNPNIIIPALLTIALGYNGMQWVNNVVSNPSLFLPAQQRAEFLIEEFQTKYPSPPETKSFKYLLTHPYNVVSKGSDFLSTMTSIGASYADAIWQQNPFIQIQIKLLEKLENNACYSISNQAGSNRCTAAFYLPAGLAATPFDTGLGVANALVVDPLSGVLKQRAIFYEGVRNGLGIIDAVREGGLEGGMNFLKDLVQKNLEVLLTDKQLQSAIFFEILLVTAILAAPVAGGVILGMTAKGLVDLDIAVTTASDKKSLIEFITSHGVRTTVVSSVLILLLIAAGLGKQASDFLAYQESLSPSGQTALAELSLLEQTQIVDLAAKMKLSPGGLEFYLTESARPGSPLANLSLAESLRVSSLAEQSGKGAFILDYVSKYGLDSMLKNVSPDALKFYVDEVKIPGSPLRGITPQEGLIRSQTILDIYSKLELSPDVQMELSDLPLNSKLKILGVEKTIPPAGVTPDRLTPVLNLSPQELRVLKDISVNNAEADFGVLGLWKDGKGYTYIGTTKGYAYLDMPKYLYSEIYQKYPGDFHLINKLMLDDFIAEKKPCILETSLDEITSLNYTPEVLWEIEYLRENGYELVRGGGPNGLDILLPSK
jgi:hypothetical protein